MEDPRSDRCHHLSSKESSRYTFFIPSFLELGNQMFRQSNRSWPFAHLTDALGGIHATKQNVLMQEGGSFEKDQDIFRKGVDSSNVGRKFPSSSFATSSESRRIHDEEKASIRTIVDDTKEFAKWSSLNTELKSFEGQDVARNGMDKQVVQEIVKSVYTLSDVSSGTRTMEETWSKRNMLNLVDVTGQNLGPHPGKVLPLDGLIFSDAERSRRQGFKHKVHTEQLWEYALTSEPMPNLLSGKPSSGPRSTRELHVGDSIRSSKFTLRKIPVRSSEKHTPATMKTLKIVGLQKANEKLVQKRKEAETKRKQNLQTFRVLKQLLCGGFAGVVSRTLVAPLDLIKTYLITSHSLSGSKKSALTICKEIVEHDGWQGLFRGNLVNCLRVAPSKAIELCVFETVRRALNKEGHPLKHAAATIAGGAAGMAGTIATYPLELLRTRLSVQPELYSSLSQAIRKIAQEEGFSAFYSGLSPSLVGVFPYAATNYFVYDGLRTAYCRSTGQQNVPTMPTLLFGAVAASASSAVTYPLEVARRQMQLSLTGALAKKSTIGVILDIYQHEGILALYRGLGLTWLKLIPAAGISFVCYETARLALQIDDASLVKPEETVLAEQEP